MQSTDSRSGAASKRGQKMSSEKKRFKTTPLFEQVGQRVILDMKDGLETSWSCLEAKQEITYWRARGVFFKLTVTDQIVDFGHNGRKNEQERHIAITGSWSKNSRHQFLVKNDEIIHQYAHFGYDLSGSKPEDHILKVNGLRSCSHFDGITRDTSTRFVIVLNGMSEQDALKKMEQIYKFATKNRALRLKDELELTGDDVCSVTGYSTLFVGGSGLTDMIIKRAQFPAEIPTKRKHCSS